MNADVNRYLTTWKVSDNKHTEKEKVTLRRLASHTAGLTVFGFPGYERDQPTPTLVQILNGTAPANTEPVHVDAVPGSISRYSGVGTLVMQPRAPDGPRKRAPEGEPNCWPLLVQ